MNKPIIKQIKAIVFLFAITTHCSEQSGLKNFVSTFLTNFEPTFNLLINADEAMCNAYVMCYINTYRDMEKNDVAFLQLLNLINNGFMVWINACKNLPQDQTSETHVNIQIKRKMRSLFKPFFLANVPPEALALVCKQIYDKTLLNEQIKKAERLEKILLEIRS